MLFFIGHVCPDCERLVDRKFVKTLQNQGYSFSDIFLIIVDMEFHEKSRRDRLTNLIIRRGTIDGYFRFKQDNSGHWRVVLTELGRQRNHGQGIP